MPQNPLTVEQETWTDHGEAVGGSDYLFGGGGNDILYAGNGNDTVINASGDAYVEGGDGDDTLFGDTGNDVLIGGNRADVFSFHTGDGTDNVTDFVDGQDGLFLDGQVLTGGDLSTYLTELGGNATFDFGGGDVITLTGVAQSSITLADILG